MRALCLTLLLLATALPAGAERIKDMDEAGIDIQVVTNCPLCLELDIMPQRRASVSGDILQAVVPKEISALSQIPNPMLHLENPVLCWRDDDSPTW